MDQATTRAGDFVRYLSASGKQKIALVIGDPETVTVNDVIPMLESGERHLMVFSPTGRAYPRRSVMYDDQRKSGDPADSGTWRERPAADA